MYLCKRGFCINKSKLSTKELESIKQELRARPIVDKKYNTRDMSYPVYDESITNIYLPKMFGIRRFGLPVMLNSYRGQEWQKDILFNGELYDYQQKAVKELIDACNTVTGGVLSLNTGQGKTFCALYAISKLKHKTLVIVNKISLMNQWKEEINTFLPSAKVGTIQGNNVVTDDCNIVVAMIQSLSAKEYDPSIFKQFGCLVVDETHKISSQVFSRVMFNVCCRYTIGLTATPIRSDGCECVFKWHIGNVIYKSNTVQNGMPLQIIKHCLSSKYYKEVTSSNGTINFSGMISALIAMKARNAYIVDIIKNTCKDAGRKILVMSDRREHVLTLYNMLEERGCEFTFGKFMGGMKIDDMNTSRKCRVILATFAAFGEGVSEKHLDTLIFATPKKYISNKATGGKKDSGSMTQICGRILRKPHTERPPIIIDIQDSFSVYIAQSRSRNIFYNNQFKDAKITLVNSEI